MANQLLCYRIVRLVTARQETFWIMILYGLRLLISIFFVNHSDGKLPSEVTTTSSAYNSKVSIAFHNKCQPEPWSECSNADIRSPASKYISMDLTSVPSSTRTDDVTVLLLVTVNDSAGAVIAILRNPNIMLR